MRSKPIPNLAEANGFGGSSAKSLDSTSGLIFHPRMQWVRDGYLLTDDRAKIDMDAVCRLLSGSYWAHDRPRSVMERAVENSICLSLFHNGAQVGFCRAVTDHATFTWICDVILDVDHRGRGTGKWMVNCLIDHPDLQTRSQVLATKDAHGLYERYGFSREEYMKRYVQRKKP